MICRRRRRWSICCRIAGKRKRLAERLCYETQEVRNAVRGTLTSEIYRDYGAVAESAWLGHSEKVAKECYLKATDEDFDAAASGQRMRHTMEG